MRLAEAAIPLKAALIGADREFAGASADSRDIGPGQLFIALRGQRLDGHAFVQDAERRGAAGALVESQIASAALPLLLVPDTRRAMGRLAAHWRRRFDIPLVAITGSNGKTTVKEMTAAILGRRAPVSATRGNLNNDIGVPLTLYQLGAEHRFAVVEMGANHPGEIAGLARIAGPTVAVITQCAPAHLEGFGSVEGVARAKAEIYGGLSAGGTAIINADDRFADLWRAASAGYRRLSFGLGRGADVTAERIRSGDGFESSAFTLVTPRGRVDVSLPLPGRHNVVNALAACACAEALGLALEEMRAGLAAMHGVKGRLQIKAGAGQSRVLDDTYNANPESLRAALEVLRACPGRHWLVLGDMGELGPSAEQLHADAGEAARASGVERLFALGELSRAAARGFGAGAAHFEDVDALVRALRPALAEDVTVLVKGSRAMALERVVNAVAGG